MKRVLVTGCARSGTNYTADVLRHNGLDVRHEHMGSDGTVNWAMAVDDQNMPFGEPFTNFEFEHIFHQIRHPLPVIRSVSSLQPSSWAFISRHISCQLPDNIGVRGARYWLEWNVLAETRTNRRFRIEDREAMKEVLLRQLGISLSDEALSRISTRTNTREGHTLYNLYNKAMIRFARRPNPRITSWLIGNESPKKTEATSKIRETQIWAEICQKDAGLAARIIEKAITYGYPDSSFPPQF